MVAKNAVSYKKQKQEMKTASKQVVFLPEIKMLISDSLNFPLFFFHCFLCYFDFFFVRRWALPIPPFFFFLLLLLLLLLLLRLPPRPLPPCLCLPESVSGKCAATCTSMAAEHYRGQRACGECRQGAAAWSGTGRTDNGTIATMGQSNRKKRKKEGKGRGKKESEGG